MINNAAEYKAKEINTGNWVYGYYFAPDILKFANAESNTISEYKINYLTLCRKSAFYDIECNTIFSGDILYIASINDNVIKFSGIVYIINNSWYILRSDAVCNTYKLNKKFLDENNVFIDGNIYDNMNHLKLNYNKHIEEIIDV